MQCRNVIQVLKKFCTLWLMEKDDFGEASFFSRKDLSLGLLSFLDIKVHDLVMLSDHLFSLVLFHCRVERVFREINGSISEGSLVITLSLKKLPVVLSRFTALTGLLVFSSPLCILYIFCYKV